jgi:hypothetical protein
VLAGETVIEKLPLPVPVAVPPPLLKVSIQLPVAVVVPAITVLPPLQIAAALLVILAVGRAKTVTVTVPLRSAPVAEHRLSVRDAKE